MAATTVHYDSRSAIGDSQDALGMWIDANGYKLAGVCREGYLVSEPGALREPGHRGAGACPPSLTLDVRAPADVRCLCTGVVPFVCTATTRESNWPSGLHRGLDVTDSCGDSSSLGKCIIRTYPHIANRNVVRYKHVPWHKKYDGRGIATLAQQSGTFSLLMTRRTGRTRARRNMTTIALQAPSRSSQLRRPLEERDSQSQMALYTDNAEMCIVTVGGPSRPTQNLLGKSAIQEWVAQFCSDNVSVEVLNLLEEEAEVMVIAECRQRDGSLVVYTCTAQLMGGLITNQHVVLLWT